MSMSESLLPCQRQSMELSAGTTAIEPAGGGMSRFTPSYFTTGIPSRAADALRLDAVDYLLKPLDPEQVAKAVNRLLAYLSLNFLESVLDRSDAASSKGRTLTADNSLRIELAN